MKDPNRSAAGHSFGEQVTRLMNPPRAADAEDVRVLVEYEQESFPVVTMTSLGPGSHPEDLAASVPVPAALWAEYLAASRRLAEAERAIVELDPRRPGPDVPR